MFQEFPKMIYKGEAHKVVDAADQEAAARADGWHDFGAEPAKGAEVDAAKAEPKQQRGKAQTGPAKGAEG